jgi:AAA domain-containing protein/relaxase-like protein
MKVNSKIHSSVSAAMRYCEQEGRDPATKEKKTLAEGEKSRAEILGGQNLGYAVDSLASYEEARLDMEANAAPENQSSKTRKCENDCLHATLSWEKRHDPSNEEMAEAAQSYLKALGMEGAMAVFVRHHDTPHAHVHIIASRIDPATGKTFSDTDIRLKDQAWSLKWEREHNQIAENASRQKFHKMVDAVLARDIPALVEQLTERTPTFTARELDNVLGYAGLDRKERVAFRADMLAQENVVALRETPAYAEASAGGAQGPVTRYTTREVLAAEMALQRNAAILAERGRHGLSDDRIAATAAAHTLKPEQTDALRHLTGAHGFSMLLGEAGTGKSHTLNAVRAAYEAEGARVIGLSWTNKVVQQMRDDGFGNAATIASELKKIENPRLRGGRLAQDAWNSKTVLIVDEAAMIATEHLAKLAAAARASGAKLILAGDDKQLGSIERGGMFETLRLSHGAAILKDVQRVKDAAQKVAFGEMHEGEFSGALKIAEKAGRLHWAEKQDDSLRGMAEKYAADVAASPDKRRFMFAFTNAEVDALNTYARAIHKQRGDLGDGHTLPTATGAQEFSTGDRILFSGNGRTQQEKRAGLTNGNAGTIAAIDMTGPKPRVTVALDTAPAFAGAGSGREPRTVSFIVGENAEAGEFNKLKLGYAGTIYKGQGATLDQTYVCHSAHWKSSAAYVALTRHKESVEIFASRETVKDLDAMARGLGRSDNKRAATAYRIDNDAAIPAGLESTVATLADPRAQARGPDMRAATSARAATTAQPAASTTAKGSWTKAREAFTGKATSRTAGAVAARGAKRAFGGLLEGLFKAFMGESPANDSPPSRGPQTVDEYTAEILQRAKAMQALGRVQGVAPISADHARMEEESAKKRDRDRGGRSL